MAIRSFWILLVLVEQGLTQLQSSTDPSCDFESGTLCNWKTDLTTGFKLGNSSSQVSAFYLPVSDHTQVRTGNGASFAYVYSNQNTPTSATMQALYPFTSNQTREFCFEFFYYFYASGPSSFDLTMDNQTTQLPIYRAFGANENKWRRVTLDLLLDQGESYQTFTFRTKLQNGLLAVDDLYVQEGACTATHFNPSIKCDFELKKRCFFKPSSEMPEWSIYQGAQFHHPDHTTHTQEGHFFGLNFTALSSQSTSGKYQIESLKIDGETYQCFRFSYLLVGVAPTTRLYYTMETEGDDWTEGEILEWQTAGSTGGAWLSHAVPMFEDSEVDLYVGIRSEGQPVGEVWLDDFAWETTLCSGSHGCDFEKGDLCTMEPVLRTSGNQIPDAQTRESLTQCSVYSQLSTKYLTDYVDCTWLVFTPAQSQKYIQHDHTHSRSATGKYLLLAGSQPNDRGVVISERYSLRQSHGKACLGFSLYKTAGSVLEVYQGESYNESISLKLWQSPKEASGQDWAKIEIQSAIQKPDTSVDVHFYLVGTVLDPTSGYIAIDDVRLSASCVKPDNTQVAPSGPLPSCPGSKEAATPTTAAPNPTASPTTNPPATAGQATTLAPPTTTPAGTPKPA